MSGSSDPAQVQGLMTGRCLSSLIQGPRDPQGTCQGPVCLGIVMVDRAVRVPRGYAKDMLFGNSEGSEGTRVPGYMPNICVCVWHRDGSDE